MTKSTDVLAFVHVEKAAGTSFIHILRHNFFLRCLDVRPFSKASNKVLRADDLRISQKIMPGLRCIVGHSVKPFSDLEEATPNIRYITILRDPVKRYLSQYQYWIERMDKQIGFEEFLNKEEVENFQTKKFSESGDIQEAISVLSKRLYLVGFVEEFDQFLVLLRKKLQPMNFDPHYRQQNLARNKVSTADLLNQYKDDIIEKNSLDIKLYDFVREELFPSYVTEYGDTFDSDVAKFIHANASTHPPMTRRYTDYAFRKIYLEPVTGLIRMANGIPAKGSY